jgi:hypothetical protein
MKNNEKGGGNYTHEMNAMVKDTAQFQRQLHRKKEKQLKKK